MSTRHVTISSLQYVPMKEDIRAIRRAQGGRLRTIRETTRFGQSARSAALAAGWPESTYRAHESGTRTIDPQDASRYVTFFLKNGAKGENFTPKWVIYGDDDDLTAADFNDLVRGESPAFRKKAYETILSMKKR